MLSKSAKVHPEPSKESLKNLQVQEDDDDEVKILHVQLAPSPATATATASKSATASATATVSSLAQGQGSSSLRLPRLGAGQGQCLEWAEIVEDLDRAIENTRTKSELYRVNGEPLERFMLGSEMTLGHITEEIMKAYGLEFLSIVSEILLAAAGPEEGHKAPVPLPEIVEQLKHLKLQGRGKSRSGGNEKLIIWVDDAPEGVDKRGTFSHALITELLRVGIEPEIVIPCHDMDAGVLVCLVHQVRRHLTTEQRKRYGRDELEFATGVILHLVRVGLNICLASLTARIILIDADSYLNGEPEFLKMMNAAEEAGHTVMYLRKTPAVTDRAEEVEKFKEGVKTWVEKLIYF